MKTGLIVIAALALAWSAHGQPYQMGAGTQDRQWLPERAHPENPVKRYPIEIKDGVTITARDGTNLDARLFLPTLAAGAKPTPCVLMSDGYGRSSNTGASTAVAAGDRAVADRQGGAAEPAGDRAAIVTDCCGIPGA